MLKKLLILFLLLSLTLVSPTLAQDIDLDAIYTSENGVLTFSHPEGWEIDDQGENIFLFPDAEDHRFSFMLLNDVIQESLGLSNDMSAEEAMIIFVGAIPGDVIGEDDIVLADYGDNSVATIELDNGGEYVIASIVETSGGLVMIQALGNEDAVDAARDVYFAMVATAAITLQDDVINSDNGIDLNERFSDPTLPIQFNYPENWLIDADNFAIEIYPDEDVFPDIADVAMNIYLFTPESQAEIDISMDTSAEEVAQLAIDFNSEEGGSLTYDDIILASYGNNTVATVVVDDDDYTIFSVIESNDGLFVFDIIGTQEEVEQIQDIYFAIIETIEFNIVDPNEIQLTETFTDETDTLTFSYPESWLLRPFDPVSISIVQADGVIDIEFQIVSSTFQEDMGIADGLAAEEIAAFFVEGLQADGAEISDDDIVVATYGDNVTASLELEDDGDFIVVTIITNNDGILITRMISPSQEASLELRNVYYAVLGSIEFTPTIMSLPSLELSEEYTSENGVLNFSHPEGWEIDDQGENIFLFPDAEDHRFSFMLLNDVIQESLGLSNDMSAEEAMIIFVGAIPSGVVDEDDIVLADYGDNSVATIELDNGGEYVIASIVETSGGLVMIQALGNEDAVDAARDVYFAMIATAVITLQDNEGDDESTSDTDEATQVTQALFISDDDALTFAIPDGWSVEVEDGDIAYYLESESDDFEDIELDIYIVTPQIEDTFGFEIDDSIGRATVTSYAAIEENGFTIDDIVKHTIGDYPVVFFTIGGILDKNSTFISAIVETDNGLILVQLEVSNKQLDDAYELYTDLIASIDYMP